MTQRFEHVLRHLVVLEVLGVGIGGARQRTAEIGELACAWRLYWHIGQTQSSALDPSSEQLSKGDAHNAGPRHAQVRFEAHSVGTGSQLYTIAGPTGSFATHTSLAGLQVRLGPQAVVAPGMEVAQVPLPATQLTTAGVDGSEALLPSSACLSSLKQPHAGN